MLTTLPNVDEVVSSKRNEPIHQFGSLMRGSWNIPRINPLLSTYKRTPPPHFTTPQGRRAHLN
jgi:hypothetical protein